LYLLHGVFGDHTNWVERGHVQDVANRLIDGDKAVEMIIVMPDAGTEWDGYFNMDGWRYEDYFFDEFMSYIEENYRVKTGKENTAIAGLSMGGGGATVYGQKHPDKFSTVYAMSALMTLGEGEGLNQDDPKFQELNRTVREESAVNFVANADKETVEELKSVRWFVDCGDDDFLFDANIAFVREMREKQIPLQFRVRDGGHDWEYWHSALYMALEYVSHGFMIES
jgi:enterochelin esterase-like enzyme